MGDYLPHTDQEVAEMLAFLGLADLAALFDVVPAALRLAGGLDLDDVGLGPPVVDELEALAARNRPAGRDLVCFAGTGAYDREVPAVVRALAGRSEFVTAYTPYQPEVAQGVLQAIFEYQTIIARLAGLPVANASLYDGASALVEALNCAVGATGRQRVLVSAGVHPHWRAVAATMARGTGHELEVVALRDGATDWTSVVPGGAVAAVVVAQPNWLGCLEDLSAAKVIAEAHGALYVVAADPVAAGVLKSGGELGADLVVGEGQALGTRLSFGGPYLGLYACSRELVRKLPGRLVGETVDVEGRRAYVTTLRAREQDIRREKATSNVCTNQTLMAVTAAIQLSWLGPRGLAEVATRSARGAHYCADELRAKGFVPAAAAPFLYEFPVATGVRADVALARLADEGFLGGVAASSLCGPGDASLEASELERTVVVAVTERRTRAEIDAFVAAFAKAAR